MRFIPASESAVLLGPPGAPEADALVGVGEPELLSDPSRRPSSVRDGLECLWFMRGVVARRWVRAEAEAEEGVDVVVWQ